MDKILDDIWLNLQSYYTDIIAFLPKIIIATIVFSILFLIANRGQTFVTKKLSGRMDDPLLARFLGRMLKIFVTILAVMVVLKIIGLGDIAAGLFAGASFSAIIVGFAFKDIGENFLAGIMLAFNRPFRVGDTVELNGLKGQVVTLNLRTSHLKTFDGKDLYIPNANVVKNPVVNYTIDGYLRHEFTIGLDYGSDADEAIAIIEKTLSNVGGILTERKSISVFVSELNTSTLDLTAQYWLDTFDSSYSALSVKTQAINRVLDALNNAGYYLPGNILELKNYSKEDIKIEGKSPLQVV